MVPGAPFRRLALLVEYEGTGFGGSQYQKNTGTIQDALERALSSLTGEPIRVALAGRTDAGGHARGQGGGARGRASLRREGGATPSLRREVRPFAAALVEVGRGKLSPKEFEAVLR